MLYQVYWWKEQWQTAKLKMLGAACALFASVSWLLNLWPEANVVTVWVPLAGAAALTFICVYITKQGSVSSWIASLFPPIVDYIIMGVYCALALHFRGQDAVQPLVIGGLMIHFTEKNKKL